jgi:hypothetical protein
MICKNSYNLILTNLSVNLVIIRIFIQFKNQILTMHCVDTRIYVYVSMDGMVLFD